MSKHIKVDGKLLQVNKGYKQLKNKQKVKISDWMYEAYKKQVSEGISNEDAVWYVRQKIDEAQIWCPSFDIEQKYNSMKKRFKNRLAAENVPQHIYQMEAILDRAMDRLDALEKKMKEYQQLQSDIEICNKAIDFYTEVEYKEEVESFRKRKNKIAKK